MLIITIIWFKVYFQTISLSCPNCSTAMTLNNRLGVEIDQCPRCKGVWPDGRELEKVTNMQNRYEDEHHKKYLGRGHDDDDDDADYYRNRKHKKGGFLGDLFDFG